HGRLAGNRVAENGEAVCRADEEGVEAVQVVETALERLLERCTLAQPPGEVPRCNLGVVLGLELDPLAAEVLAQPVVIGQRAVVNKTEDEPDEEGVRPLGGNTAI